MKKKKVLKNQTELRQGNDEQEPPIETEPPHIDIEDIIDPRRPVVIVPGIGGSDLWVEGTNKVGGYKIWPPVSGDGQFQALTDLLKPITLRPIIGPIFQFVYGELIQYFLDVGYKMDVPEKDKTLWTFPYDWTQSNRDSGKELATLLEYICKVTGWDKKGGVNVICHSMGGLVLRSAIKLNGSRPWVFRSVYIATPHFGSPKAFWELHPDAPFQFFDGGIWDWIASKLGKNFSTHDYFKELKTVIQTFPSAYELLPDHFYFNKYHIVELRTWEFYLLPTGVRSRSVYTPITTETATYLTDKYTKFPKKQQQLVKSALKFKQDILGKSPAIPEPHLVIFSNSESTSDFIYYDTAWPEGFSAPMTSNQNGDGTVPVYSSTVGETDGKEIDGGHQGLPAKYTVFLAILNFITEKK